MVACSSIRAGSEFRYTMIAKIKAVYQPTFKARSESNRTDNTAQIKIKGERVDDPEFTVSVAEYEKGLCSLDTNPRKRLEQERTTTQYKDLVDHFNKELCHQKQQSLALGAYRAQMDVASEHILDCAGTHKRPKNEDGVQEYRGLIVIGLGTFRQRPRGMRLPSMGHS
jgi:hypothetical protein